MAELLSDGLQRRLLLAERRSSLCALGLAGMALATLFVTMPFVVRELIPILEAMDMAQVRL